MFFALDKKQRLCLLTRMTTALADVDSVHGTTQRDMWNEIYTIGDEVDRLVPWH